MAVTVRLARPADVPGILRVAEAGWNAAYGDILDRKTIDAAMVEWYHPETTLDQINRDDVMYFVAVEGTGGSSDGPPVVGYASGGPADEDGVGSLGAIYVHPDRWGEGVGSALLEAFEGYCCRAGFETLRFRVLAANDIGIGFYRSHGYEAVDERETELFDESVRELVFQGPLG